MKVNVKKLAVSAMLAAAAVVMSGFAIPNWGIEMLSDPAFMQHNCRRIFRPLVWRCYGLYHLADPEPDWNRKPVGISWQHGWRLPVRIALSENRQTGCRLLWRGIRNRNSGRDPVLSGSRTFNGKRGSLIYVCNAVFNEHPVRHYPCRCADWRYGKIQGYLLILIVCWKQNKKITGPQW